MSKEKIVYIAIHPYDGFGFYELEPFSGIRDARLSNTDLEHILLLNLPESESEEHHSDVDFAKCKIDINTKYWKGRIFMTDSRGRFIEEYKTGRGFTFARFVNHIIKHFPANKYIFWGAEYHDEDNSGCVTYFMEHLNFPNKEIDLDACLIL